MNPSLAPLPFVSNARPFGYPGISAGQVAVIGEMLASLDSLTNAGRHHTMAKIVGFMQGRVSTERGGVDRARIAELMDRVKHEAARPLPVVASFTEAVQRLLAAPGLPL